MPFKLPSATEPQKVPERLGATTVPIIRLDNQVKEVVGALFQIDTSNLDEETSKRATLLNTEAREAWEVDSVLAHESAKVRALAFQTTRRKYSDVSGVVSSRTVLGHQIEKGTGAQITYERLLPEWRRIAEAIGDPEVSTIVEEAIVRVAEALLTPEERKTMAGVLQNLAYRHGRHQFETVTGRKFLSLDRGESNRRADSFYKDVSCVVAMIRHEEKKGAEGTEDAKGTKGKEMKKQEEWTFADHWDDPWLTQVRAAWLHDLETSLTKNGRLTDSGIMLCERLKMLMAHRSPHLHEGAMHQQFGLPFPIARELSGNRLIDIDSVQHILTLLVEEKFIPASESGSLAALWKAALAERSVNDLPLGRQLAARLAERGLSSELIAFALDIQGRNPDMVSPIGHVTEILKHNNLKNEVVPMHAISCLAAKDFEEVQQDMRQYDAALSRRTQGIEPKMTSAMYSDMHRYGVQIADLPRPWQKVQIPKYDDAGIPAPPTAMHSAVMTLGKKRSAEALRRMVSLFAPTTVIEAARAGRMRHGVMERSKLVPIGQSRFAEIEAGNQVPTLPELRQIVVKCGCHLTPDIIRDWHFRRAARLKEKSSSPLAKAVDVLRAQTSASQGDVSRFADIQGEVSEKKINDLLQMSLHTAEDPTGVYLHALRAGKSSSAAINLCCERLAAAGKTEEWMALLALRLTLQKKTESPEKVTDDQLQTLIAQKEALLNAIKNKTVVTEVNDATLRVLAMLPGLTEEELVAWKPATMNVGGEQGLSEEETKTALIEEVLEELKDGLDPGEKSIWEDLVQRLKLREFLGIAYKSTKAGREKADKVIMLKRAKDILAMDRLKRAKKK